MDLAQLQSAFSLRRKFNRDVLWNVASLAVLGVSGIVINTVIAVKQGAEVLGVFNQVFALYIVLSQVCVGGLHFSVLKTLSHNQDDRERCVDAATAAILLAAVLASTVGLITYCLRDPAARLLDSPGVSTGVALVAPGLLFFSLNKILFNVLNGLRCMRAYAVMQALRFLLILAGVIVLVALRAPGDWMALSLTAAELLLCFLLFLYVNVWVLPLKLTARVRPWLAEHISFGFRGFFSGVLSEMNTRVDVLMLGFFMGDAAVGVYSYAAILAEGICQLPTVVRRNVDPILGRCFAEHDRKRMREVTAKVKRVTYLLMGLIGVAAVLCYPLILKLFFKGSAFGASWAVFAILMAGVTLTAGYRPFSGILLQGGRPGMHTWLRLLVAMSNVLLNAALIPRLGIYGAAIATALAYCLEMIFLLVFAWKLFRVKL